MTVTAPLDLITAPQASHSGTRPETEPGLASPPAGLFNLLMWLALDGPTATVTGRRPAGARRLDCTVTFAPI